MTLGKRFLLVGIGFLALFTNLVIADEPLPTAKEQIATQSAKKEIESAAASRQSTDQLIEELDSADFETREQACGKLAALGKAAIAALEKAAANGNLEVSSRATAVLGKLLKSKDEATENAALKALEKLADGDSPAVARKAKSLLDNKNGLKNNASATNGMGGIVLPGNGFGGRIIINGGQLNIGLGGAMKTMSVKNVNGVKEIDASEDGKKVKIEDDPANGIKIEVTEKENGKEVTKKYQAKNAGDLKKNHPAGYEVYKKYGGEQPGNGVMLNIQAGGGNPIPGNMPAIPLLPAMPLQPGLQPLIPAPAAPGALVPQANNPQIEIAMAQVRNLSHRLERLQKANVCKDATPESKAELKKEIDELSKRLHEVRGELGDK